MGAKHLLPGRAALLWISLGVFVIRVFGQVEVLLLSPDWLPPFDAWESGLVPYSALLPIQIVLIAAMSVLAFEHSRASGLLRVTRSSTRRALRRFALGYFLVMLLRLIITAALPPHSLWDRGLIPIIAHWDLAAFVLLAAETGVAAGSGEAAAAGSGEAAVAGSGEAAAAGSGEAATAGSGEAAEAAGEGRLEVHDGERNPSNQC